MLTGYACALPLTENVENRAAIGGEREGDLSFAGGITSTANSGSARRALSCCLPPIEGATCRVPFHLQSLRLASSVVLIHPSKVEKFD